MIEHIISMVGQLGHWGYLIIFLLVTAESAFFLGFLLPGETVVILGGFLANQGILDVGDLIGLVILGAVVGDTLGFALGRHFGRDWLASHGRWVGLREKHLRHVDAFFARHGGKTVFLGRFWAVLRAMVPFVAGASGMRYLPFLFYNALGGVCWSVAFVMVGYVVGESWRFVERWIGRASALLGAALIVGILIVWAGRALVRHEAEVRRAWSHLLAWPWVAAAHRRLVPVIWALQSRLTRGGYLGLHLVCGAVVIVGASWIFGGIVQDVLAGDPLTVIGNRLAEWLQAHSTPSTTLLMRWISALVAPTSIVTLTALISVVLLMQQKWYSLLELVLVVPGGILLARLTELCFQNTVARLAVSREWLASSSFPSQHTMAAVLLFGFLAICTIREARAWRWRVYAFLAWLLLVALIGFSRLCLGSEHLTDVLGAMAEGVAWLAICLTGVRMLRMLPSERPA